MLHPCGTNVGFVKAVGNPIAPPMPQLLSYLGESNNENMPRNRIESLPKRYDLIVTNTVESASYIRDTTMHMKKWVKVLV